MAKTKATALDNFRIFYLALKKNLDSTYFPPEFYAKVEKTCQDMRTTLEEMAEYIPHCDDDLAIDLGNKWLEVEDNFKALAKDIKVIKKTFASRDPSHVTDVNIKTMKTAYNRAKKSASTLFGVAEIEPIVSLE